MRQWIVAAAMSLVLVFAVSARAGENGRKKIVFLPGHPSHGYGAHEGRAGCMLLADQLKHSGLPVDVVVSPNDGWPKDESIFNGADSIVIYCDGGGGHLLMPHLDAFDKLMKKGIGLVCIHYSVEIPKGQPGDDFLKWLGGYFETDWSVNPVWTAEYTRLPNGPVTEGVSPFSIHDEWYYHMRFVPGMKGVTPILSCLPPKSSLSRHDGPHEGNPAVRDAVLNRHDPQVMAWTYERGDDYNNGRSFGFTGGHFHWNWGNPHTRRLMLNAIVWTAKMNVPEGGVKLTPVSVKDLEANQDEKKPGHWRDEPIQKMLDEWNGKATADAHDSKKGKDAPAFSSKTISVQTPGHAVDIDIDVTGAKKLFLVADNAGDGISCDWSDWAQPRLIDASGKETKLTDLKWKSATTGWGHANINANVGGKPMRIDGKSVEYGIGVHTDSVIEYDLPADAHYTRFRAHAGLDNGGTDQGNGSTVRFLVFTHRPTSFSPELANDGATSVPLDLFKAADGFEVTRWAQTPLLYNPTNMDIDYKGRIWVCEGMDYRGSHLRPAGDRITVIEDTDGDGVADSSHTFVQEKDLESPLGVAVIDNKVIVSMAPDMIVYTDVNRDGKFEPDIDKREVLLTGFLGHAHDHSLHSVTFGPEGRLYFNHGNEGATFTDKSGRTFYLGSAYSNGDVAGKPSADGHVYVGGATYTMNPDGTDAQVIGFNYRNCYEQCVTSFGNVFNNDNDDPPACYTAWVMRYGNAGYSSADGKRTWAADRRPGQSTPIAEWRQDDPGVIPNGDCYGGGAPTGIVYYENGALGKDHRGMLLSCESAKNVVYGYYPKPEGAGFKLERFDFLTTNPDEKFAGGDFTGGASHLGGLNTEFRPSDVAVGPDGAVYVADWFDPRVGGHQTLDKTGSGAIYRVAPKGFVPHVPKFDADTIEGEITALCSPAVNVRAIGFMRLHDRGEVAVPAVSKLLDNDNPYIQARAIFLLAQLGKAGIAEVEKQLHNDNAKIRVVAYRALRQVNHDFLRISSELADDPSPAVRREVALSMRDVPFDQCRDILVKIAQQYDGHDRWYVEALGTGAMGKEAQLYKVLMPIMGKNPDKWSEAFASIAWRLHPADAIPQLKRRALNISLSDAQRKQAVDALAFIPDEAAGLAMVDIAQQTEGETHTWATWWVRHKNNSDWRPYKLVDRLPAEHHQAVATVKIPSGNPTPGKALPPIDQIAKIKGDAARGKALFYGRATCMACHTVAGKGAQIGPELTDIARKFAPKVILDSIINPSAAIEFGYELTTVETKDGKSYTGFILGEGDPVLLKDPSGNQIAIDAKNVKSQKKLTVSLMPPAQTLNLSPQDLADLVAFLESVKQ